MSVRPRVPAVLTAVLAATATVGAAVAAPAVVASRAARPAASVSDGYPDPLPAAGPDLAAHDPSLYRAADGRWYVASTHHGIELRSSADLRTWRREAPVFPRGTALAKAYTGDAMEMWAPDVTHVGNRYVLYYAASTFGSNHSAIGLATSPSGLPGTWTDRGAVVTTDTGDAVNAIDPDLFVDADGSATLSFGSFWSGIAQVRLDPATGRRPAGDTSAPTVVASRPDHPTHAVEAASLSRVGDWYYLAVSFDYCCRGLESSYRVMVGRSHSPRGPFVDRAGRSMVQGSGTQVVGTHDDVVGPGGADVSDVDGTWRAVYHYYDGADRGTPHLAVNALVLDADGWPHLAR